MKKIIAVLLASVLILAAFPSCDEIKKIFGGGIDSSESKPAVVVAIANTQNTKTPSLDSEFVTDNVLKSAENFGHLTCLNIDANPSVVFSKSLDIKESLKNASGVKLKKDAEKTADNAICAMKKVTPVNPEVDYLKALKLSSNILNSLDGYNEKLIIILGSLLSTSGIMNFKDNLLAADGKLIADLLSEKQAIPDLAGIKVVFIGIGETEGKQSPLSDAQHNKLVEIWRAVVERGGGMFVEKVCPVAETIDKSGFPEVSVIDLPPETSIIPNPEEDEEKDEKKPPSVVPIPEADVCFLPDSAEFADPSSADEEIKKIADFLKKHPDIHYLLAGTTAGDQNTEFNIYLSYMRASAIRDSLIRFGAPEENLIPVGLGSESPWHIKNLGLGAEAAVNRAVYMIDSSSETAQQIINR